MSCLPNIVVLLSLLWTTAAIADPTTAPTSRPTTNATSKIDDLLSKADAALAKADYDPAKSLFLSALDLDPQNLHALQGAGLAALHQHVYIQAHGLLMRAMNHDPGARLIRPLSYNFALACVQSKQPLPAADALQAYLESTDAGKSADWQATPLLWKAIYAASDAPDAVKNADKIKALKKFAELYDEKVNSLVPGKGLWGNQWRLTAAVTAARTRLSRAETNVETAAHRVADDQAVVAKDQAALDEMLTNGHRANAEVAPTARLKTAKATLEKAQSQLQHFQADTIAARPPLGVAIEPLNLDELTPPAPPTSSSPTTARSAPKSPQNDHD